MKEEFEIDGRKFIHHRSAAEKVYFSKHSDPKKWDMPRSLWPAWFWVPVLRFFGFKVIDLRKPPKG